MEAIKTDDYHIWYDQDNNIVYFEGSLRLNGVGEYAPIISLVDAVVDKHPEQVSWDLRKLEFLNSSGINVLYKFVLSMRKKGRNAMKVVGSNTVPWQQKSLANMKKFLPSIELEMLD